VSGLVTRVLEALAREPLAARELLLSTGAESDELDRVLDELERAGMIGDADAELPDGVMPWSGEEMPVGSARTLPPPEKEDTVPPDSGAEEPEDPGTTAEGTASHRRLYESEFGAATVDERVARARTARGDTVGALCLDPEPQVIAALLENPEFGLGHARLVALHHRNARGLEIVARRLDWLRDAQVARHLLKNPQLPESSLARLITGKRLRDLHKLCVDRDLPELTRTRLRAQLRKNFTVAAPEERVDLVMRTEGRALPLLVGCTFDGRSSQMLASQTFASSLLVQNLARFAATPPAVLAKLLQQPMVRRQPQLRALLLRHPNVPSEAKRG
jgi:hypothetical protein